MKKNGIIILLVIIFSSFSFMNYISAKNIFNNEDEAVEKFNYDNQEDDNVVEKEEEIVDSFDVDKKSDRNNVLILVEIFCGLVGLIMLFMASKVYEA